MLMRRVIGREGFLNHPSWKKGAEVSILEISYYNGTWWAGDSNGFRHSMHQLEPVNPLQTIILETDDARTSV